MSGWKKVESTSDNKEFKPKSIKQQLQDINSKLGAMSGYSITARYEIQDNFKEVQKLLVQIKHYSYSIHNKTELYFCITVILFLISFGQQQLGNLSSFTSLFSDQNILKIFK